MNKKHNLVWIDLEMTGLNPDMDVILEIATIITDSELNIIAEGPEIIINQPEEKLLIMDEWVRKVHQRSGLIDAVRKSNVSCAQAAEETFDFIRDYCERETGTLAGNSVWVDRAFLRRYMPQITDYLHYRIVDVSSVKVLVRRWYPNNPQVDFKKSENHRALEDVRGSIEELRHFREYFFVDPNE